MTIVGVSTRSTRTSCLGSERSWHSDSTPRRRRAFGRRTRAVARQPSSHSFSRLFASSARAPARTDTTTKKKMSSSEARARYCSRHTLASPFDGHGPCVGFWAACRVISRGRGEGARPAPAAGVEMYFFLFPTRGTPTPRVARPTPAPLRPRDARRRRRRVCRPGASFCFLQWLGYRARSLN